MQTAETVWIVVNGHLPETTDLRHWIEPGAVVIAADGGLRHLRRAGLPPQVVIGDLDSAAPDDLAWLQAAGVSPLRYSPEKDETDLELALEAALRLNPRRLRLAAALGGRMDQTLANIFTLQRPELIGIDARLEDGLEEVFLIRVNAEVMGQPGDLVSLLPLNGAAQGVRTAGLRYPLYGETLYPDRTRGVSNELLNERAQVSLDAGLLLCIHRRKANEPA